MLEYYPPKNICENNQFILFCFQANKIWRPAKRLDLSKANDVLANKTKTVVESILIVWNTEKNIYILLCHCYKKRIKTCGGWREYVFCVPHLFTPPPSWESFKRKSIVNTYRKYPLTKPIKNISTKMGQQPQCFPMIDYMIKIIIMIRLIMVGQGGRSCVKAQRALAEKFGLRRKF